MTCGVDTQGYSFRLMTQMTELRPQAKVTIRLPLTPAATLCRILKSRGGEVVWILLWHKKRGLSERRIRTDSPAISSHPRTLSTMLRLTRRRTLHTLGSFLFYPRPFRLPVSLLKTFAVGFYLGTAWQRPTLRARKILFRKYFKKKKRSLQSTLLSSAPAKDDQSGTLGQQLQTREHI